MEYLLVIIVLIGSVIGLYFFIKKQIEINSKESKKEFESNVLVKVRSTGKLLDAKVNLDNQNSASVDLKLAEDGISPGQACVFYSKDTLGYKVLGGGWIKE